MKRKSFFRFSRRKSRLAGLLSDAIQNKPDLLRRSLLISAAAAPLLEISVPGAAAAVSAAPAKGLTITAVAAGYGRPPYGHQEGVIAFLATTADAVALYRDTFVEDVGDSGSRLQPPITLCAVGANATDPLVPVRDGPFWADRARWVLWREANVIHAINAVSQTVSLTLPESPARMLRPALQRANAEIQVMALSPDRRRLDRLTFPRDAGGTPRVNGFTALPGGVISGAAGFAPDGDCAVLIIPAPEGLTLLLARPDRNEPPRTISLGSLRCPPGMEPAIAEQADGSVRSAILAESDGELVIAEVRFPPGTAAGTKIIHPLGQAAAVSWRGALCYWNDAYRVLLSLPGRWLAATDNAPLTDRIFSGTEPIAPLTLLPTAHGALCLTAVAGALPHMAPV